MLRPEVPNAHIGATGIINTRSVDVVKLKDPTKRESLEAAGLPRFSEAIATLRGLGLTILTGLHVPNRSMLLHRTSPDNL